MPAATLGIEDPQAQGGAPRPLRNRMPMEMLAPPLLVPPPAVTASPKLSRPPHLQKTFSRV